MIRDPEVSIRRQRRSTRRQSEQMRAGHDGVVHLQDNVPPVVVREGRPALGPAMRFTRKGNE